MTKVWVQFRKTDDFAHAREIIYNEIWNTKPSPTQNTPNQTKSTSKQIQTEPSPIPSKPKQTEPKTNPNPNCNARGVKYTRKIFQGAARRPYRDTLPVHKAVK